MEPTELSLSPSCRILLVSKANDQNRELVSLLGSFASTPLTPNPTDGTYIEWTIKNKYYTAPVHLYLHQVSKLPAKPLWPPETDNERVPALIFVFRKGEPYRDVFLSMKEAYLAHDAEVALAVSLPIPSGGTNLSTDSFDSIEGFFSDHNFEYVDVEDSPKAAEYSDHLQYDVRGLPRILEALNMIMWPSMVRTATGGLRRTQAERSDQSPTVFEQSFATVSDTAPPDHPSLFGIDPRSASHSLVELNAWLDDNDSWAPVGQDRQPATADGSSNELSLKDGFDDDFTEFLSAPPEADSDTGLPSSAEVDAEAPGGFDLTSILGALEAMRLEIGAIEDVEERRKAAARVALGLAAGLGIDERDEDEDRLDEELMRELHQIQ